VLKPEFAVHHDLRADVAELSRLERLPCSDGERAAAEWIAARLRETGAKVRIDEEQVHGTYFVPLGLLSAAGALAGAAVLRGRRSAGVLAALAAGAIEQDVSGGSRRWFRQVLPRRSTWNVVGEFGSREAGSTVVVHAHHDAARTSFVFDQRPTRLFAERFPRLLERMDRWPPVMGLVVAGPALVATGSITRSRTATVVGSALAAGTAGLMAHMSRQPVVPGANDNLSGVAVLLAVARDLEREPPAAGLRVVLLSTGAEESNQEGMLAFARRHFQSLEPARTTFVCLDSVGSPELVLIEGEGFLRMFEYPDEAKELVAGAAREAGVWLRRGLRLTFATDGLIALRRGYQVASIASVNANLMPSNYHMPTDTAENVDYGSVSGATRIVLGVIRALGRRDGYSY
jgi:Peptidase family M28